MIGSTNTLIHKKGGFINPKKTTKFVWDKMDATLPFNFLNGAALTTNNNEIQLMGGPGSAYSHYKWNGTSWVSVSTLPYEFYSAKAVVYEGKIHILGTGHVGDYQNAHYVWDGTKWESASTLPYKFYSGGAVKCDYKIFLLGGGSSSAEYRYFYCGQEKDIYEMSLPHGTKVMAFEPKVETGDVTITDYGFTVNGDDYMDITFSVPSKTPITIINNNDILYSSTGIVKEKLRLENYGISYDRGQCIMYNGELHSFGGASDTGHYRYNFKTRTWTADVRIPYRFVGGSAIVYNGDVHLFGTSSVDADYTAHYKFDGTKFEKVSNIPYRYDSGRVMVIDNKVHIFGTQYRSANTSLSYNHYIWDGTTWTKDTNLPMIFDRSAAEMYNGELHIFGGYYSSRLHYKWNGTSWTKLAELPFIVSAPVLSVVYKGKIHAFSGMNSSAATWHGVWDGTKWIQMEPIPISLYSVRNAFIYNDKIYFVGGYAREIFYTYDGNEWDNRILDTGCYTFKNMRLNGEIINSNKNIGVDEGPILLQY